MGDIFGNIGGWLVQMVYSLPGILIGLVFHEFAHAFTADRLGDPTPRMMGRLTLNPMAHLDPIGLLMLFVARFGWAKPVMTNPSRYKVKRYGYAMVGFAGPLMNFFLAALLFFPYLHLAYNNILPDSNFLMQILINAAFINVSLGIFNLIPIPPLDGYNILKDIVLIRFIRPQTLWNLERYGQLILIGFVLVTSQFGVSFIGRAVLGVLGGAERLYRLLFL